MSPAKIGNSDGTGIQEYIIDGQYKHLGALGAIETGSKQQVDVEGLLSRQDGYQAQYFDGTPTGRVIFLAGNEPIEERPCIRLRDGRVVTPVREDEMPNRARKEW
jgi:hypothetical protein